MAFTPQRKRRKPGERFPTGFIKRKIELIISNQFPVGVREPDLRDILREKWKVSEPKGVKIHLAELEEAGILTKEEKKGLPNVWKLSQDYETFKVLVEEFYKSKDEFERDIDGFMESKYVQSVIDEKFVDHFAAEWWKEYYRLFIQVSQKSKPIEKFRSEELRDEFYSRLINLTKDDLTQILRVSPSSLYNFLFPRESIQSSPVGISPSAYFLFPFVADVLIHGIPEGKGVETKLEVKYGGLKNIKGETKIIPSLKTAVHTQIFIPKVPPLGIVVPPKSTLTLHLSKRGKRRK